MNINDIPQDWQMYEDEANRAVAKEMLEVRKAMDIMPLPKVRQMLKQRVEGISKRYGEVYDTEVRSTIRCRVTQWACQVHELREYTGLDSDYWEF